MHGEGGARLPMAGHPRVMFPYTSYVAGSKSMIYWELIGDPAAHIYPDDVLCTAEASL